MGEVFDDHVEQHDGCTGGGGVFAKDVLQIVCRSIDFWVDRDISDGSCCHVAVDSGGEGDIVVSVAGIYKDPNF